MFNKALWSVALLALPALSWAQSSADEFIGERFPTIGEVCTYSIPASTMSNPVYNWIIPSGNGIITQNKNTATITWSNYCSSLITVTVSSGLETKSYYLPILVSEFSRHFSYKYDENGARTSRTPIVVSSLKSAVMTAEEIAELEALLAVQDGTLPKVFGSDSLGVGPAVRIYPNPTQAIFSFNFAELPDQDGICAGLALTTLQGAPIPPASCGEGTAVFDLSNYPAGGYLLQLSSGSQAGSWLVSKY